MKHVCALIALSLMLLLTACGNDYPSRLPDVLLTDAYGNTVSAADLAHGSPVIVTFYATWCDPCVKELDEIASKLPEWKEKYGAGVVMISIDRYPSQLAPVLESVKRNGWDDFTLLFDTDGDLMRELEIQTVPTVFYLNGKGQVVQRTIGLEEENASHAETVLKAISSTPHR